MKQNMTKISRESWKWRLTREKFVWKWKFNIVYLFVTNLMSNIKGGADRLTPIKIFYLKLTPIILKKQKPFMYWNEGFLIEDGCSLTWRSPQQMRSFCLRLNLIFWKLYLLQLSSKQMSFRLCKENEKLSNKATLRHILQLKPLRTIGISVSSKYTVTVSNPILCSYCKGYLAELTTSRFWKI